MSKSISKQFISLLKVAALLPKADKTLSQHYKLSRKQIYLIYLISCEDPDLKSLSDYAEILNISTSTLSRNVEKLEKRKVLERVKGENNKIELKLLSQGQLYAIEISKSLEVHFRSLPKFSVDI